uniref:Uncharacterized protein n=1 Tax=viral metagenome TaxID=1070528 RepID=A0A6C0C8F5_9ZZZZ
MLLTKSKTLNDVIYAIGLLNIIYALLKIYANIASYVTGCIVYVMYNGESFYLYPGMDCKFDLLTCDKTVNFMCIFFGTCSMALIIIGIIICVGAMILVSQIIIRIIMQIYKEYVEPDNNSCTKREKPYR